MKNVTTKEIAALCGVSRGTVDRALNGRPGISPETSERIRRAAEELGYRPHQLARSLVKGKTYSIGVVVFDLYNPFFAQLLNAVTERARELGYFVYITLTDKNPEQEKDCVDHLAGGRVDGMILCPVRKGEDYIHTLLDTGLPVVTVMNTLEGSGLPHVGIDDYGEMRRVTEYVLALGYRRLVYLSPALAREGETNIYCQKRRYEGFLDGMRSAESGVEYETVKTRDYEGIVRTLTEDNSKKGAVICSSDAYSLELMDYVKKRGLRVPETFGVMGFDDSEPVRLLEPRIATVSIPVREIGRRAAEQLIALLEEGITPPERTFLPCTMVRGETVR